MSVFLLFQTDSWKSKASRVFFGAFDSRTKALDYAKYNDLYFFGWIIFIFICLNYSIHLRHSFAQSTTLTEFLN